MLNLEESLAVGFVLLAGAMFLSIVVQNWPGPFFPDIEPRNFKYQDNDGVWVRCTASEFKAWTEEELAKNPATNSHVPFELAPLYMPPASQSKFLPKPLRF